MSPETNSPGTDRVMFAMAAISTEPKKKEGVSESVRMWRCGQAVFMTRLLLMLREHLHHL